LLAQMRQLMAVHAADAAGGGEPGDG